MRPLGRRLAWAGAASAAAAAFAALAVVLAVQSGAPLPLDTAWHHWAVTHRTAAMTTAAAAVTSTGTGVAAFALAAAAGALGAGGSRWWRGALAAAAVLAICVAVRFGISQAMRRPRPPETDWARTASGFAFPSGHTTTSAVVAALFCLALTRFTTRTGWRRAARLLVVAWAVTVGLSRIYLGVHWPTDVLGGWLLALGFACTGCALAGPRLDALLRKPAS